MNGDVVRPAFWDDDAYVVLDQRSLPEEMVHIRLDSIDAVADAVRTMVLRGAPLIGAAASAGMALSVRGMDDLSEAVFRRGAELLLSTRPTAVNLRHVLDETCVEFADRLGVGMSRDEMFGIMRDFSISVHTRDRARNRLLGEYGADYIIKTYEKSAYSILTHCNAGALATCGYGTALGVVRALHERGRIKHVWVDETRPYLQGSRLTAWELEREGIEHTVITDSTASYVMAAGNVDVVVTGADRVAANGDVANKIGTRSLAVNAAYHNIPFCAALPCETVDPRTPTGDGIQIEERDSEEVLSIYGVRTAPTGTDAFYPAFDIVPAALVSALITEKGVLHEQIGSETVPALCSGTAASD